MTAAEVGANDRNVASSVTKSVLVMNDFMVGGYERRAGRSKSIQCDDEERRGFSGSKMIDDASTCRRKREKGEATRRGKAKS